MKIYNPFKDLTTFERILLTISLVVVSLSFMLSPEKDWLTLIVSLIGVIDLIFVAKGYLLGQILGIVFSVLYGIISFIFHYYGEVITYMGMTAPMAIASLVSWIKHPYKNTKEVEIQRMNSRQVVLMFILASLVTVAFYFILKALSTANLLFSTISIATSFLAVYMTYMRSPFYAIAYGLNDIVLITLWILASIANPAYIPMIFCFVMFLANDTYAFVAWMKRMKKQEKGLNN